MSKKVVVLTEGGGAVGFGHVARCCALCQALKENGADTEIYVRGNDTVGSVIDGISYKNIDWITDTNVLSDVVSNANVVVIDSYLAEQNVYKEVSERTSVAVFIDDNARLDYPDGIIVNGNIHAEQLSYKLSLNSQKLIGIKYFLLRRPFWNLPQKKVNETVSTILIALGGGDVLNIAENVLGMLNCTFPKCKKQIIVGQGFRSVERIQAMTEKNVELIFSPSVSELKEVMMQADIALTASGQMLTELVALGVPVVSFAVIDNQLLNLQAWDDSGAVIKAGDYRNTTQMIKGMEKGVNTLMSYQVRSNRAKHLQKVVDGKGAMRVSQVIMENITSVRGKLRESKNS